MSEEFLPFSRPSISRAAIDEVVACLESGWITTGPRVAQFTEKLKDYLGAPFVMFGPPHLAALTIILIVNLLVIYLHLGRSEVQVIQSEQCPANGVKELLEIIRLSSGHPAWAMVNHVVG